MAISPARAAELADLLPDELRCDDARQRLLCVAHILMALTDSDHVLSNADIRAILRERFGSPCSPSENTVAADLAAIRDSGALGLVLHTTPAGTWAERSELTPAKVRMLLNAVQSSRFLTIAQSAELQEGLFGLVSRHQEDDLAGQVHVDQRVRRESQQVFDTIDVVSHAMHQRRKIEFEYTFSGFSSKPIALEGDDGSTLRVETPVALYYADGNYYVETYSSRPWRHGINLMRSRADRMASVRISEEPADATRAVYDAQRSAARRMREGFEMIEGPVRRVFLRVRSNMTNVLFDRFGFGLKFGQFEGTRGDPTASGLTFLQVPQAFTFFRWLSSAGDGIVISEPPSSLGLSSGPWAKAVASVSREELLEDYQAMVEGFLAYLDRARAPYA